MCGVTECFSPPTETLEDGTNFPRPPREKESLGWSIQEPLAALLSQTSLRSQGGGTESSSHARVVILTSTLALIAFE